MVTGGNCSWIKLKRKEERGIMEMLAELFFQNLKCETLLTSNIDCFRVVIMYNVGFFFPCEKYKIWGTTSVFNLVSLHGGVGSCWVGWGLHYRTRKGDVPRLILLWQSLPILQKDCGNVGKEGVCDTFWCTPVLGEQVCCLLCNWSNLPCPLQVYPCFSFSHHLRKQCLCWVSLCVRWSWWSDVIWQYNYNCRKNRKNGTFFSRMVHPVLTFIWHVEVLMLHVLQ